MEENFQAPNPQPRLRQNFQKSRKSSIVFYGSILFRRNRMDPAQSRLFFIEWPRELDDSLEFHVELETLLAEFSLRLGTLAEHCLQEHVLH
jgi:hypothetical protein